MPAPARGDVWDVDLNPTVGHEQSGRRPALILSADTFNRGPAQLVVAVPITSKNKKIPLHVRVVPPEGGLKETSYIKCEDIRSISVNRLFTFRGLVSDLTLSEVADRLRVLLEI